MSSGESSGLSADARQRLEQELDVLRSRRADLDSGRMSEDRADDEADSAEMLRRADEVVRIDDRINEITRLMAVGGAVSGVSTHADTDGGLADGTMVTLRFDDGGVRTLRAVAITEAVPEGEEDSSLTLDSPLGQALAGHDVGDSVSYETPEGTVRAEIVGIRAPGR